jgi:hypothetical protein
MANDTSTFNTNDKITFNELAPSLQNKLNNTVTKSDYDTLYSDIQALIAQVGDIRTTITSNPSAISNPKVNKELVINTSNNTVQTYTASGFVGMHSVYS